MRLPSRGMKKPAGAERSDGLFPSLDCRSDEHQAARPVEAFIRDRISPDADGVQTE